MKSLIVAALVLMGSSAMAETIFNCAVPESKFVSMNIDLADDQSADFVTVSLSEKSKQSIFFSQMDKGAVTEQLNNGFLQLLALTDKSAQEDGVIKNTGFLAIGKEADGSFGGFLAANGNIYPLSCSK
ncbi:hypothetical protein [Bdellovibrio bacteriovorus]|uniref:Uncharacterized protein n=1 Tax=Bdellovibrio bacteriovorus TaxID=959 RepID=A0A150WTI2_BDEBC|nr:hypothetical protein [Bdellovibrio bacteriovorus]KYG67649.1 hypothetical protein AZI85_16755 [Bdellovibrio bacteriovorus]